MKTQLATSESAKLIELGVSRSKANGIWLPYVTEVQPFTLIDILDILPKKITFGHRTNCRLKMQPIISSKDRISEVWQACYLHTSLKANAEAPELIDALYSLLVWCMEEGYVKLD
ncbi:hypothetical protein [Paramuribaculum intestinale]|uniref:hypothetical protein n=2 Tax=Paramuribaculum intestinale TaxID=2094151 RepID=UPI0025B3C1E2|nr:hypothetical protein [Paramuribaculum intestinale]